MLCTSNWRYWRAGGWGRLCLRRWLAPKVISRADQVHLPESHLNSFRIVRLHPVIRLRHLLGGKQTITDENWVSVRQLRTTVGMRVTRASDSIDFIVYPDA